MTAAAWLQLAAFVALLLLLIAWPRGRAIGAVVQGRFALGSRLEAPLYRLAGVDVEREHGWVGYALGLMLFYGIGVLAVYAVQRLQAVLPLNPQALPAVSPTRRSTRPSASSRTRTGRATVANRR